MFKESQDRAYVVLIVRNLGMLTHARAKHRDYISVRCLWRNYTTKVSAER